MNIREAKEINSSKDCKYEKMPGNYSNCVLLDRLPKNIGLKVFFAGFCLFLVHVVVGFYLSEEAEMKFTWLFDVEKGIMFLGTILFAAKGICDYQAKRSKQHPSFK